MGVSITLAILAAVLLLPSLFYPFARDQGVFAYVGSVILKGGWPYRDVWEVKPPGIYYTYAAILAGTGGSMAGVRGFDLFSAVATALLLRAALQRYMASEAAWLAALLYAALYLRLGYWGMAQAESYVNLCTAAALLAWLNGPGVPAFRRSGVQDDPTAHPPPAPRAGAPSAGTAGGRAPGGNERPANEATQTGGVTSSVAAGAATAAALLLKVTALPPLAAALGVTSLLRIRQEGRWQQARRCVPFLSGLLAPLALVAIAMARSGAGAAYLDIQRGFVAGYVAMPMSASGSAAAGWRYFWHLYWLPTVLAAGGLLAVQSAARLLLAAWLSAAVVSVAMQQKYFGYHWTPVLLPLAALAGAALAAALGFLSGGITTETRGHGEQPTEDSSFGGNEAASQTSPSSRPSLSLSVSPCLRAASLRSAWARRQGWRVYALGALLIAGWSVGRAETGYGPTARLLTGRLGLERYWYRFGRPYHGDFSFLADAWAAAYLRGHTRPTDRVYIWGFEPLTLFLAGRRAPTRFVFAVPLVAPWSPLRWREEFLRELRADPPVLFGVMRHDAIPHASGRRDDSAAQLDQFPALRSFLRHNYHYETTIEDLTLYRRQAAAF